MLESLSLKTKMKILKWGINWYPPYIGAGVRLQYVNKEYTHFRVQMKLKWFNFNLVSTHFGGSLYSMCDPFFVFILIANLGEEYIIWDQAASIQYLKPGKGKVLADFQIAPERIEEIRADIEEKGRATYRFETRIYHAEDGGTVATVIKDVYVRKKRKNQ